MEEECYASAVLGWQERDFSDERLERLWMYFQLTDAFGRCVEVDIVDEMGVEIV